MTERVRRVAATVLAACMTIASCGGDESAGSTGGDGEPSAADLQELGEAFLALSPEEQSNELARRSRELEQAVARLSGLEAELGGADATAQAMDESWGDVTAQIEADLAIPFRSDFSPASSGAPVNAGHGLFQGYLIVGLGAEGSVTATRDVPPGPIQNLSDDRRSDLTIAASIERALMEANYSGESKGVSTSITTKSDVQACPDVNGAYTATATVDVRTTSGAVGQTARLAVTVNGQVNDNADRASSEFAYTVEWADFVGTKGKFIDLAGRLADGTAQRPTVDRSAGTVDDAFVAQASQLGYLFALMVYGSLDKAAEVGWKSGRCVRIDTAADPGPGGLQPRETSTLTASPRSAIDGSVVGGTVSATMSSGGANVDPSNSPLQADAQFQYTAPDQADQTGVVALEARSKRGIGKRDVTFDTKTTAYTISGSAPGGVTISGTAASLVTPFTAEATIPGGSLTLRFEPANEQGGAINISGGGSGATQTGNGSYTNVLNEDGTVTLTFTAQSCVDVSNICQTLTQDLTLTPVTP